MPKVMIVYGDYDGGYYSEDFRAQEWSEWEEVTTEELKLLENNLHTLPRKNYSSAHLLVKAEYSIPEAIKTIREALEEMKLKEEERKKKAKIAAAKRAQTALEKKKKQLQKLKKELGIQDEFTKRHMDWENTPG
jgi:DNA repair exonuclease SbcCD nuclease subunit